MNIKTELPLWESKIVNVINILVKRAYSARNFEKCIFSIILYTKVEHLQNVLKFQDDWSKIEKAKAFRIPTHPTVREMLENFKHGYFKTTFSETVDTISQKLLHRSVCNFPDLFYTHLTRPWTKDLKKMIITRFKI